MLTKNNIEKLYKSVLTDRSWKVEMPVLDYSVVFPYEEENPNQKRYDPAAYTDCGMTAEALRLVRNSYPNLPGFFFVDYNDFDPPHKLPWKQLLKPTDAVRNEFLTHVKNKLATSRTFPFPDILSAESILTARLHFGMRMFLHDLYLPGKLQELSRPATFYDSTVGIMRQCPTVTYDQPEKMFSTFPIEFLLINPYFTIPRDFSFLNTSKRFSLFDLYLPPQLESTVRNIGSGILDTQIEIIYQNNPSLILLAKKMKNRARMVCGEVGRSKIPPNYHEFLLERDRCQQILECNKTQSHWHMLNLLTAKEEARNRSSKEKTSKVKELTSKVIDTVHTLHIEEFN
jgi:hypothetical protein